MKKRLSKIKSRMLAFALAATIVGSGVFSQAGIVSAAENNAADTTMSTQSEIAGFSLADGTYYAAATAAYTMFKPVKTAITVANGTATVKITLSGTSWGAYFFGTAEEAEAAETADVTQLHAPEVIDDNGVSKNVYTMTTTDLSKSITMAAKSSKGTWRDVSITVDTKTLISIGTYEVSTISKVNPAMFKVDKAVITATDTGASATITMSGTGYEKLYMGSAEAAATADAESYIAYVADAAGKYTFTIPVTALNTDVNLAAYGTRGSKWYDRTLEFCIHDYKTTVTPATTTAAGSMVDTCGNCGTSVTTAVIPAASGVNLSKITYTCNGKVQKPAVSVKDSNGAIISSDNYNISYSNAGSTDAGTYTATVTFKGNYKGSKTLTYTIAANTTGTAKLVKTAYTYNGKVQKAAVKVTDRQGKTIASKYYSLSYSKGCKNVGTYQVKVTFKGNYKGTKTLTYKINPKATTISSVKKGKKAFSVTVKKSGAQTTGYQIQYSVKKNFSAAKTVKVKSYKTTTTKVKNLKAGKKYYVRVRTYKTVGSKTYVSGWSKVKTVTTAK